MEWECTLYRLEHINLLQRILLFYTTSLDQIDDDIQKEKILSDIVLAMKTLVRKTVDKCGLTLPPLPPTATELVSEFSSLLWRFCKLNCLIYCVYLRWDIYGGDNVVVSGQSAIFIPAINFPLQYFTRLVM